MNDDYVSVNTAHLLYEIGYNGPYDSIYIDDKSNRSVRTDRDDENIGSRNSFPCPRLYDAIIWLWEYQRILVGYVVDPSAYVFRYSTTFLRQFDYDFPSISMDTFATLQDAIDAGISDAVKIIIRYETHKCSSCNSYHSGWCTNFGKKVDDYHTCFFYMSDIINHELY